MQWFTFNIGYYEHFTTLGASIWIEKNEIVVVNINGLLSNNIQYNTLFPSPFKIQILQCTNAFHGDDTNSDYNDCFFHLSNSKL